MIIHKGYKFRLEPSVGQVSDMNCFAGFNRAVWNKALEITKDRLDRGAFIMVACSDSRIYPGAKVIHKHECNLARAQRSLTRKVKFSNRWKR